VTFASIIECFRHCFLESVQRSWSSSTMGFAVDVTIIRDVATPEATAAVAVAATAKADASNGTTPLLQGKRHGDILHFYNLVFVPMLEVSVFEILCWGETCDWRCRAPFSLCASRAPKQATTLFLTPVPCSLHCSLLSPSSPHTSAVSPPPLLPHRCLRWSHGKPTPAIVRDDSKPSPPARRCGSWEERLPLPAPRGCATLWGPECRRRDVLVW
jgi:hypothetical protein